MAKLRNISYLIKEIAINSSTTNYELNGIIGNNLEFYGLDSVTGNYKELPKAWYQLIKVNGNYAFKVVDNSVFKYSKIQVGLWYDNKSMTYLSEFNPDIKVLVDRYNVLVNTVSQLWEYTKRQAIVGDSMEMHLILPKLKTDEVWICKGDHYEAISIVDLNAELRKLIDQYANMYKVELEQKTNEQKGILNTYTNSQKESIELYKDEKLNDLLNKLTSLKSELDTYTSSKKEEMDRYRTSLNDVLYNENKNRINDYTNVKFREIDIRTNDSKNAIELKKTSTLNSMEEPIAKMVEVKVDGIFTSKNPVYLSQLKTELDSYVATKQAGLNTLIEGKVDDYIATKDGLITQKVIDIATTNINQAVATAKQNVFNEIQNQTNAKVQEAVDSFNTQANTISTEKLKIIKDSVSKFMQTEAKQMIITNVNEYMQSFNVITSKSNGKIKLLFTLKDFRKEVELPDNDLGNGSDILNKILNDTNTESPNIQTLKRYLDVKNLDENLFVKKKNVVDNIHSLQYQNGLAYFSKENINVGIPKSNIVSRLIMSNDEIFSEIAMDGYGDIFMNKGRSDKASPNDVGVDRSAIIYRDSGQYNKILNQNHTPIYFGNLTHDNSQSLSEGQYIGYWYKDPNIANGDLIGLPQYGWNGTKGVLFSYSMNGTMFKQYYIYEEGKMFIKIGNGDWVEVGKNNSGSGSNNNNSNLQIRFTSNSSTFLGNEANYYFNIDYGKQHQCNAYFKSPSSDVWHDVYCGTLNAKSKLIAQNEIISSGDITAFSDIRLKTNIEKIENALDKVCQLSGYTYDMNDKRSTGVIAQEVEKVLPEVVQDREDGYKTVAYGNMIGLLIEAIKELKEEIKVIKNGN